MENIELQGTVRWIFFRQLPEPFLRSLIGYLTFLPHSPMASDLAQTKPGRGGAAIDIVIIRKLLDQIIHELNRFDQSLMAILQQPCRLNQNCFGINVSRLQNLLGHGQ